MDLLEDFYEKSKSYIKNMSLKKAMSIYILIAMVCVCYIWIITVSICNGWETVILNKCGVNMEKFITIDLLDISSEDKALLKFIDLIKNYSIIIYSMIAITITSHLYYRNKIKEPLKILKTEDYYVAKGDLSFECKYESNDEMAVICETFNNMRLKLIENNETMWNLIEEQSNLNAILAHDLRNPLSILEGYNEMLIKYVPEGKVDEEKLLSTLKLMNKQVIRMKEFLNRIKSVRSFSDMRIKKETWNIGVLLDSINEIIKGFKKETIDISMEVSAEDKECFIDINVVEEVVGNLLSNAVRFAEKNVKLIIKLEEDKLYIIVKDDGRGFSQKELYKASEAFYTSEKDNNHFGIGLNICKTLAEKHGGSLSLSNSIEGGAIVCVDFQI